MPSMSNKIIRSICLFSNDPGKKCIEKLQHLSSRLAELNYVIQTLRLCSPNPDFYEFIEQEEKPSILYSMGTLTFESACNNFTRLMGRHNISFNIDLTSSGPTMEHVDFLFNIIKSNPKKCFNFTYVINNVPSSPYFPSSTYEKDGFSIGLQPTNLSLDCQNLDEWFSAMKQHWTSIVKLFANEHNFLGIDSSIAPLLNAEGSLISFLGKIGIEFNRSVISPIYTKMTKFITTENPKKIGLCGLMLPCLEDFELAEQYSIGNFSIERNIFLSMHSGLGIDTYPIGIDENKTSILDTLKLLHCLSLKYNKPLSARFISDGKAKIGEKTNLQSPYLKDVIIRPLLD